MGGPAVLSRCVEGTIAYRLGDGSERGRERFELLSYPGGHTLRALCEMDDISLLRDVSLSMDDRWRPLDGFSRVLLGGRTAATSLFMTSRSPVQFEGEIDGLGRVSQSIPVDGRLGYLGLHPLAGDALMAERRGEDEPGVFRSLTGMTNSKSANGEIGLYAMMTRIEAAFVGHEDLTVAAGRFAARRFALRWKPEWPAADLWVRREDSVFLQLRWSLTPEWYELTSLRERPGAGPA